MQHHTEDGGLDDDVQAPYDVDQQGVEEHHTDEGGGLGDDQHGAGSAKKSKREIVIEVHDLDEEEVLAVLKAFRALIDMIAGGNGMTAAGRPIATRDPHQ